MDPALVVGREAPGRHDAMHVRMTDQGLPPRVEDAEHTDLGPEMTGIGGDLTERRRPRLEEPGVQPRTIPISQREQRMRQREDDVHIRHVEQIALACVEPALPRLCLTLRAMPVAAANGELSITCLMESARFWGARVSSRFPTRDIRSIRRTIHSP